MALLDAVVYPHPQGHFGYGLSWSSDATSFGEWDPFLLASLVQNTEWGEEVGSKKASPEHYAAPSAVEPLSPVTMTKRKRRRPMVVKNEEEIESQRMTHIAVERNRRRQMNEYLAVLRSLMPPSYAQRVFIYFPQNIVLNYFIFFFIHHILLIHNFIIFSRKNFLGRSSIYCWGSNQLREGA